MSHFTRAIFLKISLSAPSSNRRSQIPPIPRGIITNNNNNNNTNNSTEPSSSPATRLPSAGDALRRTASTGKVNQLNNEKATANSIPASGLQRQISTVRRCFLKAKYKDAHR